MLGSYKCLVSTCKLSPLIGPLEPINRVLDVTMTRLHPQHVADNLESIQFHSLSSPCPKSRSPSLCPTMLSSTGVLWQHFTLGRTLLKDGLTLRCPQMACSQLETCYRRCPNLAVLLWSQLQVHVGDMLPP